MTSTTEAQSTESKSLHSLEYKSNKGEEQKRHYRLIQALTWPQRAIQQKLVRLCQNKRDRWYELSREYPDLIKRYNCIGPVQHALFEDKPCSKMIREDFRAVGDIRVGNFVLERTMGIGAFGRVFRARFGPEVPWEGQVAIKVIPKHRGTVREGEISVQKQLKNVHNEIGVLQNHGHHPNIVDFYEVLHSPKNVYIVLEMCDMNLDEYMCATPCISPEATREIMRGVLAAVDHLHKHGIYHLDLKPGNVLLADVGTDEKALQAVQASNIRLCDFGLCKTTKDVDVRDPLRRSVVIPPNCFYGTQGFAAPELVTKKGGNASAADMWSVGCILLALLHNGQLPPAIRETFRYEYKKNVESFLWQKKCLNQYNTSMKDQKLAKRFVYTFLMQADPAQRPTAAQALNHPYFKA